MTGRLAIWLLGLVSLAALYLLGQQSPMALLFLGVWLPLPILVVGWRLGAAGALSLAGVAMAALLLFSVGRQGWWEQLNVVELLLLGTVLSVLRERGLPFPRVVTFSVGLLLLAAGAFMWLQGWISGQGAGALLRQKAETVAAVLKQAVADSGVDPARPLLPGVEAADWGALILKILPALWVINTALVAFLNLLLVRGLALAWGEMPPEVPLHHWSAPEWLIFPFLAAGFLLLAPVPLIRLAAVNFLLVLGLVYFFQGLAVVAALFERFHLPGFLRLVGFLIAFMNPVFLMVTLVGLLDLWLDFRRLNRLRES